MSEDEKPYIKQIRHPMDWVQVLTIVGSMIGVWYAFYNITDKKIDKLEERLHERIDKIDARMDKMDTRMDKMDAKMDEMNERWYDLLSKFHSLDKDVYQLKEAKDREK